MTAGPRPIRALFLVQRTAGIVGGTERQADLLASALRRRGHAVGFVAGLGWLGTLGHAVRSAGRILLDRPDVVHVHLISAHAVAACTVAPSVGVPVVVKVGASRAMGDVATSLARPGGRAKIGFVARRAAAFVAPNDECAAELRAAGVPTARIRVIPNGVDLDRFWPPAEGRGRPTVLFAGRLELQKGIDLLLAAWPRVGGGARLVVAGEGRLAGEVRRVAAGRADVEFVGAVADPAPLHRSAAVFVLPSRAEGISNALLEAMACGCAPVATRIPGNDEVVEDGVSGILVPPEDPEALAAGIRAALERAAEIGAAARRRVEDRFGIERVAGEVEALYREVIGSRP